MFCGECYPWYLVLFLQRLVSQVDVPLGLCITRWPHGYSMQAEQTLQTLGRMKAGESTEVHFEVGDAVLVLPIESTAGMFLLSPLR